MNARADNGNGGDRFPRTKNINWGQTPIGERFGTPIRDDGSGTCRREGPEAPPPDGVAFGQQAVSRSERDA